jgi:hypothetical protein
MEEYYQDDAMAFIPTHQHQYMDPYQDQQYHAQYYDSQHQFQLKSAYDVISNMKLELLRYKACAHATFEELRSECKLRDKVQQAGRVVLVKLDKSRAHVASRDQIIEEMNERLAISRDEVMQLNHRNALLETSIATQSEMHAMELDDKNGEHLMALQAIRTQYSRCHDELLKASKDAVEISEAQHARTHAIALNEHKQKCNSRDDIISKLRCEKMELKSIMDKAASKHRLDAEKIRKLESLKSSQIVSSQVAKQSIDSNRTKEESQAILDRLLQTLPVDAPSELKQIRLGFFHFLEEFYRASEAYHTDRLLWQSYLMSRNDDKNRDDLFFKDQLIIVNECAKRHLSTSFACFKELFQIWLMRPGDLDAKETDAMNNMINIMNQASYQIIDP